MHAATRPIVFRDRLDAARRLAERLQAYAGQNPLVLAIPRGGVPMGKLLADQLGGEFDVVLARKDVPASYHLCVCHDDAVQEVTHG